MSRAKIVSNLIILCLLLGVSTAARAAATYTLTCTPERGNNITLVLTGFNMKVTAAAEGATGVSSGAARRSTFELSFRFAPSKDYQTLVSMVEDNETLRSCKLTDTELGGATTATDSWNTPAVTGKANKNAKNAPVQPAASSSGAFEWVFTNATISSITAIGNTTASGAAEGQIQATLEAQKFSFTM